MQARFIATVEPHPEPRVFRARRGIPPGEAALVIYALVLDKQSSPYLTWRRRSKRGINENHNQVRGAGMRRNVEINQDGCDRSCAGRPRHRYSRGNLTRVDG